MLIDLEVSIHVIFGLLWETFALPWPTSAPHGVQAARSREASGELIQIDYQWPHERDCAIRHEPGLEWTSRLINEIDADNHSDGSDKLPAGLLKFWSEASIGRGRGACVAIDEMFAAELVHL